VLRLGLLLPVGTEGCGGWSLSTPPAAGKGVGGAAETDALQQRIK